MTSPASPVDPSRLRQHVRAQMGFLAAPGGTVWSRIHFAESLPVPTPMTWAILQRFLSGRGGLGLMYRDLGYPAHAALEQRGPYDLLAGHLYCNLSREPLLYSGWLPLEHPYALLRTNPLRALAPRAVRNPARLGPWFWLFLPFRLPFLMLRSVRFAQRLAECGRSFATRFRQEILPAFRCATERERSEDHSALSSPALLERLEFWIQHTLCAFARESLKPTALAALALGRVERRLRRLLGPDPARLTSLRLTMGVRPEPESDLAGALQQLAAGTLALPTFLARFGHRASQEMELAQPRWSEQPAALAMLRHLEPQPALAKSTPEQWEELAAEAGLSPAQGRELTPDVEALQTYLALKATGRHYLMSGYALIRQILLELDRRAQLQGGVFFLTPEELPALTAGKDLSALVAQRRADRAAALALELPPVLFSEASEDFAPPSPRPTRPVLRGITLSLGTVEGRAVVLERFGEAHDPGAGDILVAPALDSVSLPLVLQARALVLETGGVLSHAALLARELGVPAIAGLPGVQHQVRTGQRLRVEGATATVTVLAG